MNWSINKHVLNMFEFNSISWELPINADTFFENYFEKLQTWDLYYTLGALHMLCKNKNLTIYYHIQDIRNQGGISDDVHK